MRTASERTAAIENRTRELKRKRRGRRVTLAAALSSAASLALITAAALFLPRAVSLPAELSGGVSGAGALFAADGPAGTVLIGVLAFALGCCVTILCFRLSRKDREAGHDRDRR